MFKKLLASQIRKKEIELIKKKEKLIKFESTSFLLRVECQKAYKKLKQDIWNLQTEILKLKKLNFIGRLKWGLDYILFS